VRRQHLASATGDLDLWRTAVAPDVEWIEADGFPLAGTYRTPDSVLSGVFEQLAAAWADWITHDDTYLVAPPPTDRTRGTSAPGQRYSGQRQAGDHGPIGASVLTRQGREDLISNPRSVT
jgi:ketosteroid isomerase-like protein